MTDRLENSNRNVEPPNCEVSITIGTDGRVYCHDITPALIPVLAALCGDHDELEVRRNACDELAKDEQ
ncbi:MAG: hypothetical protein H6818_24135 [Phycisphaerales bacterium]|nr:hypothetical protein [Phycisphaerales bacterium]